MNIRFWWTTLRMYSPGEVAVFVESAYLRRKLEGWSRDPARARVRPRQERRGDQERTPASGWLIGDASALPREDRERVIHRAKEILEHRIDLLGSGMVDVHRNSPGGRTAGTIEWHTDPVSGYRWEPGKYHTAYERFGLPNGADVKFTRELSRGHHLVVLGTAYQATGDETFAGECVAQMLDWERENPWCRSINWDCAMDVAIRAANWITALALVGKSAALTNNALERIELSLYRHSLFIVAFLEYAEVRTGGRIRSAGGNHYLADLCGLLFICYRFPRWTDSSRWRRFALRQFYREIERQISEDGVHYEHSVGYHRLSMEMMFYTVKMIEGAGEKVPAGVWSRIERGFEYTVAYTKPDGSCPQLGDSDDGHFLLFGDRQLGSHRYLACLGALQFRRGDFVSSGSGLHGPAVLWFGHGATDLWKELAGSETVTTTRLFAASRLAALRSGGLWVFANASGPGIDGTGGHTHNDLLSFEMSYGADNYLVDSGTFTYSRDPAARNRFRGTSAHNTVMVDHEEQQRLGKGWDLWTIYNDGRPALVEWDNSDDILLSMEHSGYARLAEPVTHRRRFLLQEGGQELHLEDRFAGEGTHTFSWFWNFAPGILPRVSGTNAINLTGRTSALTIECPPELAPRVEQCEISPSYGIKTAGWRVRMDHRGSCPCTFAFRFTFARRGHS